MIDPLPHNTCATCHEDFHKGEFKKAGANPDCKLCHTVVAFQESTFGFDQHEKTDFPLQGAHMATPCFECHLADNGQWKFVDLNGKCVSCHDNVHVGEIDPKFYPDQNCTICHTTENWVDNKFDHGLTSFKLSGVHAKIACEECHKKNDEHQSGLFKDLDIKCLSCHNNVHGDQFYDNNHEIACQRCHGFENWSASAFNHNQSNFKLDGRHAEIECSACHKASHFWS
ncbi:MAG: hypothetical protein IPL65_04450 [Lewinellaceae bacterium]|nr:hypothetical protein [Lewinellaceae bacterium]